ncbi:MAG: TonB-dependent receptor [Candidatus Andeanibacterium colombiense]|uniref:TonB-dependent receptor n=1 Tax=Candidatus Andeanibacterium colombiense TaxID=3121345 RepID=A0AAJ5X2B2_9SPHN|nr:MAG: TonB-dependent receptor [Sphingomonadaceae bacterium]
MQRSELDFANPVVSVSAETIQQSGRTNLADLLVQSPALLGSTTGSLTGGSNTEFGESGLDLLNLRNLGSERTLVLVDGRRHVAAESGSAAVDINTIPTDLVEAVDVLTGGASAIYGADGVSGVVNFRLKHDFEGITARGQYGISRYGDGENLFGAVTAGQNFAEGRGNIALAYEYSKDERVSDQQRPWLRNPAAGALYRNQADIPDDPNVPDLIFYNNVRYADSAPVGAVDTDFDFAADFEGNGKPYDRGLVLDESGGYTQGGSGTPVDGYQGDLFPGIERHLVNGLFQYEFADALTLFAEGKYVRTHTRTLSQPTYDFYVFQTPGNPFMPQSIRDAIVPGAAAEYFEDPDTPDGVLVTRDNFDLGINLEDVTRETLRSVIGAKGKLGGHLTYEVSYVYGQTKSRVLSRGNRLEAQWQAAIDVVEDPVTHQPVCRSSLDSDAPPELAGCVPYNIFGEHDQDPAAIAFVTTDSLNRSKVTQNVVSGSISGDTSGFFELPGGPIGFALGAEYRKESSSFDPDQAIADGLTWQGAVQAERGSFDVKEVFGEVNLPILKEVPGAYLLSVGAAMRLSDYSTVGGTTTWKVDGVYAPLRDISFRATYSQAVRAPNIGELFGPASTAFNFIVDPCDTQETNNGTSTRAANCATLLTGLGVDPATFSPSSSPQASVYTEGLASGNPDLQEETAKTWTAGVVLRPTFLPGFSLSADWYDITIKNAINTAQAQDLAQLCVDQPTLANQFCSGITRDPDTGYITGFTVKPANVAQFSTAGLDLTLGYRLATRSAGTFNVSLVGNYLDRLEFISSPGAQVDSDRGEIYAPKYSATFDFTWTKNPVTINYGINWFSKTDRFTAEELAGDPDYADPGYFKIKPKWEHDFQISYNLADVANVYVGMQNIFDARPAFDYSSYPVSGMGRYIYVGVTLSFGPAF